MLERYSAPEPVNIGAGGDLTIAELAAIVRRVVGLEAELVFDASKPDGTPRKLLDVSRIRALGWEPKITLEEGISSAYEGFLAAHAGTRAGALQRAANR